MPKSVPDIFGEGEQQGADTNPTERGTTPDAEQRRVKDFRLGATTTDATTRTTETTDARDGER